MISSGPSKSPCGILTRFVIESISIPAQWLMIFYLYQADWKALRGALVGCLALMRRKGNTGMVTGSEAQAVCQSYLQNLQVQSLGQHDRKVNYYIILALLLVLLITS